MRQLFDGLMGWAVLADSDRIVSKNINDRDFHQGAQPHRAPHVIDENKEPRAEGPYLHQAQSVQDGSHGVFADAEVKIASAVVLRLKVAGAFLRDPGLGGWSEICGSSNQPGNVPGGCVQHHTRRLAGSQAFWVRGEFRKIMVPAFRELPMLHAKEFFGEIRVLLAIFRYPREPGVTQLFTALSDALTEVIVNAVGYVECFVFRPAIVAFRKQNLFFA